MEVVIIRQGIWLFDKCFHVSISNLIDGLVQYYSNSIASTLDLLQSCTKPPICYLNLCELIDGKKTPPNHNSLTMFTQYGRMMYNDDVHDNDAV